MINIGDNLHSYVCFSGTRRTYNLQYIQENAVTMKAVTRLDQEANKISNDKTYIKKARALSLTANLHGKK